jgi:peptidoglycan/LPS O-acetylase OafA/YrhL
MTETRGMTETLAARTAPDHSPAPGRDRYLDLLRALALLRVVLYHLFGWAWLTVLFPSMGVMFALAGSLMARSLERRPAPGVLRGRLRRLLPPLWAFAAVLLPLLLLAGWNPMHGPDSGGITALAGLLTYLVPLGAPPYPEHLGSASGPLGTTWAADAAGPLWYLRAYLWFVLASPLLLRAWRRAPWPTLLAPLALAAVLGTGLVTLPGEAGDPVTDFAVYGACWILGFAHHQGALRRVPRSLAVSGATFLMAAGLAWAAGHRGDSGWDLNDIPLAQALWSFGAVVVLLHCAPSWRRLPDRLRRFDGLITLANNRAVTVYLWHNLLITATVPLLDQVYRLPLLRGEEAAAVLDAGSGLWMCVLVWPLLGVAILAFGWVEDLAARRRPRPWPAGKR